MNNTGVHNTKLDLDNLTNMQKGVLRRYGHDMGDYKGSRDRPRKRKCATCGKDWNRHYAAHLKRKKYRKCLEELEKKAAAVKQAARKLKYKRKT